VSPSLLDCTTADMRAMPKSLATSDTPIGDTRPASTRRIRAVGRATSRGDHGQLRDCEGRPACPGLSGSCRSSRMWWDPHHSTAAPLHSPLFGPGLPGEPRDSRTRRDETSTRSSVVLVRLRPSGGSGPYSIRVHRSSAMVKLRCICVCCYG
jgi:hypothetical protein